MLIFYFRKWLEIVICQFCNIKIFLNWKFFQYLFFHISYLQNNLLFFKISYRIQILAYYTSNYHLFYLEIWTSLFCFQKRCHWVFLSIICNFYSCIRYKISGFNKSKKLKSLAFKNKARKEQLNTHTNTIYIRDTIWCRLKISFCHF